MDIKKIALDAVQSNQTGAPIEGLGIPGTAVIVTVGLGATWLFGKVLKPALHILGESLTK